MKSADRLLGHIVLLCITSGLLGIAIGAFILTDPVLDQWLYKWQTLIAGSFAIAAAVPTIIIIRRQIKLQRLQHIKHEVDIEISLVRDQEVALRKIENAIKLILNELDKDYDFSEETARDAFLKNAGGANGLYAISSRVQEMQPIFRDSIHQISEQVNCMIAAIREPSDFDKFNYEAQLTRQLLSGLLPHIEKWADAKEVETNKQLIRLELIEDQLRMFD